MAQHTRRLKLPPHPTPRLPSESNISYAGFYCSRLPKEIVFNFVFPDTNQYGPELLKHDSDFQSLIHFTLRRSVCWCGFPEQPGSVPWCCHTYRCFPFVCSNIKWPKRARYCEKSMDLAQYNAPVFRHCLNESVCVWANESNSGWHKEQLQWACCSCVDT